MSEIALRVRRWWNDWRESAEVARLNRVLAERNERVAVLEEQLESEQVKNRIQQVEIDELVSVVARNHQRVKRETEELGGMVAKRDTAGDVA